MIRAKPNPAPDTSIELTPLIDIVFIVVVFLLLTANTRLLSLPIEIPRADSHAQAASSPATLVIGLQASTPHWAIDNQQFDDWPAFKSSLLAKLADGGQEEQQVHIAPARNADVEPLVKLLALLNEQQVHNTQILMKEPD